ncbi:MAG TPA: flavin reductase family protein, partial [Candidatus Limnocylindrales bacterium]
VRERAPQATTLRTAPISRQPTPPLMLRCVNVEPADFRAAIGQFATGVTIVTTLDGERPSGITVNAFASVSLEPSLVMIALDRRRFIVPAIEATGRYAVNVLAEDQQWLSDCFAGANVTPGREAFCGASWRPGQTGLPLLAGATAVMECRIVERIELGDHLLFVGAVEAVAMQEPEAPPLLYHRRRYLRIERASTAQVTGKPENPAD